MHAQLTELFASGGVLNVAPKEIGVHFDDPAIVRLAKLYMSRSAGVASGGQAVVVSAGPPGAGKTSALNTLRLDGYRRIDPDQAKDLVLEEARKLGLLDYRLAHTLLDGGPVGIRELSTHIHSISAKVADTVRQLALATGENVVIEGTLSWDRLPGQYIKELFNAGYESLDVVDVEAPLHVTKERARERWWTGRCEDAFGGRFVPEAVIEGLYSDSGPEQSCCVANARALAERAGDELGQGRLLRFDVDPDTGTIERSFVTSFGPPSFNP